MLRMGDYINEIAIPRVWDSVAIGGGGYETREKKKESEERKEKTEWKKRKV